MQATTFKYFALLVFAALSGAVMPGCNKMVEIDLPEPDKKPVVNCFFTHDKTLNFL